MSEETLPAEVVQSANMLELRPAAMVERATEAADVLKDVITRQELFVNLNGNKHVKAEGWSCLGNMLSILPKEDRVIEHDDGSFEAYVSLINNKNGFVVGGGSGFVGMDEKNWKTKPRYARRSMAITRATSKAYKTCFSWIVSLAGYNPTPAEEMDGITVNKKPAAPKPAPKKKETPPKKSNTPLLYTGTNPQKIELAKLFDKHGVKGPLMKSIHETCVKEKCLMDELEKVVEYYQSEADLDNVPFAP